MNDYFFNLPAETQLAILKSAEDQLNMSDTVLEKDAWVCWLLEKLFTLPVQIAFKGGTSLSKVFGLIKRFSEDIDITVDYRNFRKNLDLMNTSRSQLKKISAELKVQLSTYIKMTVLPFLKNEIQSSFPNNEFEITLSDDGEKLRFYYPTVLNEKLNYFRDHVLIEFGIRNDTSPNEKYIIKPFLNEIIDKTILLPKATVDTLSPIRTFWEKATLMHVECHRDRIKQSPERLSRHWYALFIMENSWVGQEALLQNLVLENVIKHKKAFFNASYCHYDDCFNGNFRIIPNDIGIKSLANDFKHMCDAGMFIEDPPSFEDMIHSLRHLQIRINDIFHKK